MKQASASRRQPAGVSQQASASRRQPAGVSQQASASRRQPAGVSQQASASRRQPAGVSQQASASRRQPAGVSQQASASNYDSGQSASGSRNLNRALVEKDAEFYTQLKDIQNELWNYRGHFKNKIIFCNCDDPTQSNFWKYFKDNFKRLGLKKLISTHYRPSTLFEDAPSYKLEYDGKNGHVKTPLKGDGDFRSAECAAVMQEADIVATNPPFSLLREFIKQVMKHDKKFLIIGNMNAVSYKEIFPLFAGNKIWLGYTPRGHEFMRPDGSLQAINSVWYTNLAHDKRHEKFRCLETYDPNKYPRYDNYPAIEVGRTNDIPKDYAGEMGVPITFLDKYNPDQFEIVGLCRYLLPDSRGGRFYVGGNQKYARIVIKHKKGK